MNKTEFDASFFVGNRERLRQLFTGTAPIVLTANGLLQQASDEPYPFHQDRNFWYLTGIDEPGIVLVMDKGKEYLIVPPREVVREQFDGAIDLDALGRQAGIHTVMYEREGWKQLESRLKRVQSVATLGANPKYIDALGMYTNPARAELIQRIKDINPAVELLDLRAHLSRMRMVKQDTELACIQEAIDITIDTIKEVTRPKQLVKYAYEYEIEADITRGFRRRGGSGLMGHAFPPIVASGERGCTMHHITNNGALASGELLILDVGAQSGKYAADITRTVLLGDGRPAKRQQTIYDAVLEAQQYAFSLLKPGVILHTYEKQMEEFVGEKLRELGLIKTIDRESVRYYFPHATSHFLGLDTHDAGDYDHPLEPGVVLAVEPGIYVPDEALGVRIEDNVVITPEGCRVLSERLPRVLA
ncbi:MAG TPA: Xaa-Pro aminopeptidase [Candidatus Saccharimonadales bacterium]|nr:Xaa-Pro aminopeptidase [Candidatus Saccharimonadales bacterium]